MESTKSIHKSTYGFLTVVDCPQNGLFGGYLALTPAGRPLEFHCTAPIKPNRAQEILYGHTLEGFLYGEQIGSTLIKSGSIPPLVVFTDCEPALAARQHTKTPLVLVLSDIDGSSDGPSSTTYRVDAGQGAISHPMFFRHGRNRLALPVDAEEDRSLVGDRLAALDESFDLTEPFDRIREAIEEARQAAR